MGGGGSSAQNQSRRNQERDATNVSHRNPDGGTRSRRKGQIPRTGEAGRERDEGIPNLDLGEVWLRRELLYESTWEGNIQDIR